MTRSIRPTALALAVYLALGLLPSCAMLGLGGWGHFTFIDEHGTPIEGVEVWVQNGSYVSGRVVSGADGKARIEWRFGYGGANYVMFARHDVVEGSGEISEWPITIKLPRVSHGATGDPLFWASFGVRLPASLVGMSREEIRTKLATPPIRHFTREDAPENYGIPESRARQSPITGGVEIYEKWIYHLYVWYDEAGLVQDYFVTPRT